MLLSLTNRTPDATDLGHLLHKHPARVHETTLPFGTATVFYPRAEENECTAVLSVDVDPVGLVRSTGGRQGGWSLGQYVNDRPYTASSFLATALSRTFGTALNGRCTKRPELVDRPLDLELILPVIQAPDELLQRFFAPLGYSVEITRLPLEPAFPDWGEGRHATLRLRAEKPLHQVLRHLFVLIPALDRDKHYWVGREEIDKLLAKGEGWLGDHPECEWIVRRYLKYQQRLTHEALDRLAPEIDDSDEPDEPPAEKERRVSLHEQRLDAVAARLEAMQPQSVVDLGCGEGKLVRRLVKHTAIPRVLGMDVSSRALGIARDKLDRLPASKRDRAQLVLGSLIYRDSRLAGFDAAALVEVIEHLDPDRLEALEQVVFAHAAPRHVLVTTPNREYNVLFENMAPGALRHADHRFEWTRAEFETWARQVAADHGYEVALEPLGEEHPDHGAPSQMAVFRRVD
ncbi:3' terminal RNA ribose 2'-O-methyltransferase Hen1 [Haloferula sargassicola]|uniref:Small RNA 2'-O-methyltransferase n=1 Tax=Haloferula sargassicola TaxID=490096 RepID=A0ABP9UHQ9_9BACT